MIIFKIRFKQFIEEARENGSTNALRKVLHKYFYLNKVVVPTYKDLSSVQDPGKPNTIGKLEFLVVNKGNIDRVVPMYGVKSRQLKAIYNVGLGYTAFAIAINDVIVGDIWCATFIGNGSRTNHPDLKWLGIDCDEKETYMLDMYLSPENRGNALSNYLLGKALFLLKEKGYSRVYGYYENKNISALWAHRVAQYTEMKKRKILRVIFYRKTQVL